MAVCVCIWWETNRLIWWEHRLVDLSEMEQVFYFCIVSGHGHAHSTFQPWSRHKNGATWIELWMSAGQISLDWKYFTFFFAKKMSKRLGNRNKVIITRQAMHIGFITRPKVIFYSPKRLVKYNFWTRDINLYVTAWCVIIPKYDTSLNQFI